MLSGRMLFSVFKVGCFQVTMGCFQHRYGLTMGWFQCVMGSFQGANQCFQGGLLSCCILCFQGRYGLLSGQLRVGFRMLWRGCRVARVRFRILWDAFRVGDAFRVPFGGNYGFCSHVCIHITSWAGDSHLQMHFKVAQHCLAIFCRCLMTCQEWEDIICSQVKLPHALCRSITQGKWVVRMS